MWLGKFYNKTKAVQRRGNARLPQCSPKVPTLPLASVHPFRLNLQGARCMEQWEQAPAHTFRAHLSAMSLIPIEINYNCKPSSCAPSMRRSRTRPGTRKIGTRAFGSSNASSSRHLLVHPFCAFQLRSRIWLHVSQGHNHWNSLIFFSGRIDR